MYVIIICMSYIFLVNAILHICYCNLWWDEHKEYGKYAVLRRTSNNHEIMANIISTGGEVAWRRILRFNGGGAHGVMVIIVGNGYGDTSSNPRRDWLHFT